jgi:drug/metabolite transporter (DMT)-like permease
MPVSRRPLAILGLLLIAATWGLSFAPMKMALTEVTPEAFLQLRVLSAFLFLAALAAFRARRRAQALPMRATVAGGTVAGLTLSLIYWLQTSGLALTTSSKAGFITGLTVVFVPLLYAALRRRRPEISVLIAALVSCAGIGIASLTDLPVIGLHDINRGDLLLLAATVFNASHIIMMGTLAQDADPVVFNTVQAAVNVAFMSVLLGHPLPELQAVPLRVLAIAVVTGCYAIGVLLLIQSWAQSIVSPMVAGLIFTSEPVFALVGGVALLDEAVSMRQAVGFSLVLLAMVAVETRHAFANRALQACQPAASPFRRTRARRIPTRKE